MGYKIKIQRVERRQTKSIYLNFPAALADAAGIEKGEEMEWLIEDKNSFVLRMIKSVAKRKLKLKDGKA